MDSLRCVNIFVSAITLSHTHTHTYSHPPPPPPSPTQTHAWIKSISFTIWHILEIYCCSFRHFLFLVMLQVVTLCWWTNIFRFFFCFWIIYYIFTSIFFIAVKLKFSFDFLSNSTTTYHICCCSIKCKQKNFFWIK